MAQSLFMSINQAVWQSGSQAVIGQFLGRQSTPQSALSALPCLPLHPLSGSDYRGLRGYQNFGLLRLLSLLERQIAA